MTRRERLIAKFLKNPASLKYKEIEGILLYLGFVKQQGKGSHIKFSHPFLSLKLSIPIHNGDCLPYYKKEASKLIKTNFYPHENNHAAF